MPHVLKLMTLALILWTWGAAGVARGQAIEPGKMPEPDVRAALIAAPDLARKLASTKAPLVFDVREELEFAVSHLPGAVRIPPSATLATVAGILGAPQLRGAEIVLYCTASFRSQQLADAIHHDLLEAGFGAVQVLAGGIIAWANAGLPLINATGPTVLVHTYDADMARLLIEPSRARYEPRS